MAEEKRPDESHEPEVCQGTCVRGNGLFGHEIERVTWGVAFGGPAAVLERTSSTLHEGLGDVSVSEPELREVAFVSSTGRYTHFESDPWSVGAWAPDAMRYVMLGLGSLRWAEPDRLSPAEVETPCDDDRSLVVSPDGRWATCVADSWRHEESAPGVVLFDIDRPRPVELGDVVVCGIVSDGGRPVVAWTEGFDRRSVVVSLRDADLSELARWTRRDGPCSALQRLRGGLAIASDARLAVLSIDGDSVTATASRKHGGSVLAANESLVAVAGDRGTMHWYGLPGLQRRGRSVMHVWWDEPARMTRDGVVFVATDERGVDAYGPKLRSPIGLGDVIGLACTAALCVVLDNERASTFDPKTGTVAPLPLPPPDDSWWIAVETAGDAFVLSNGEIAAWWFPGQPARTFDLPG